MSSDPKQPAAPTTDPAADTVQEPTFWLKFLVYFTIGLLWVVTLFGILFIVVIYSIGSRHSYIGDLVDEYTWTVLIVAVGAYTLLSSLYLGFRGYRANYTIMVIVNIVLITAFVLASIVQNVLIFYIHT